MSTPCAPDPFESTDVLTLPAIRDGAQRAWEGFQFVEKLDNETFYLPDIKEPEFPGLEAGFFELKLDDLSVSSLDASSVSDYATADEHSQGQASEHVPQENDDLEDIWVLHTAQNTRKKTTLTSWDQFLSNTQIEPGAAYLSEAGADVFDALVQSISKSPIRRLKSDNFHDALFELALGRSSTLFAWNAEKQAFSGVAEPYTVPGFTPEIIAKVVKDSASSGALFNNLRRYQLVGTNSPSVIAFDAALGSCLTALEIYMEGRRSEIVSVLTLHSVCEEAQLMLSVLDQLKNMVQCARSDTDMILEILRQCASWSLQHPKLTQLLHSMLAATIGPVLERLAAELGLVRPTEGFQSRTLSIYHLLDAPELLQIAKETHESLDLLQAVAPDSLTTTQSSPDGIALRLAFSWDGVYKCQESAARYEATIRASLFQFSTTDETYMDHQACRQIKTTANQDSIQHPGVEIYELCQIKPSSTLVESDELQQVALACLRSDSQQTNELAVPLHEVLELSLSPIIYAQHRLLSISILDVLFSQHRLQSHLRLLQQSHLFADGNFAARLSMALFDNELASGEDQRRTGATTGLRLQTRKSWPPASSELRLALMGVMSDSLRSTGLTDFEQSLSFAIRDLSDNELDQCQDMDSIHALDFFKIHYKPPNAVLEAILSSESLEKYDRIFKYLLRVLRLKSVAQSLLRTTCPRGGSNLRMQDLKLHVEIQRFISVVADYCHNVAITVPWTRLQSTVEMVQGRLKTQDYDGALGYCKSLEQLRELHSGVLDDVLRALFLKQKENKVMAALEEIFEAVLRHAASLRRHADDDDMMTTMGRLHDGIRNLVRRFIDQVASATNRAAPRADSGHELDPFEQLLLMLDFNGYWTRE